MGRTANPDSLRQRVMRMEIGDKISVAADEIGYYTLRTYASQVGFQTGHTYTSSVDRATRSLTITRTA